MFTGNDAVLPFPLRHALDRVDAQLDLLACDWHPSRSFSIAPLASHRLFNPASPEAELIYDAFPLQQAS
jgi:hypothetical protein